MCPYDEWCGCGHLCRWTMFDTCEGVCNGISIWHLPGQTCVQSSSDWQTRALIIGERHDCSAINSNLPGGTLPAACYQAVVGLHMYVDTIAEIRQLRLAAVLLSEYVYSRSQQVPRCRIVVLWIICHGKHRSAMPLEAKTGGDAAWQPYIVS